jgi:predicted PhzF superfamily epimerase YddE/YHI9
MGNIIVNNVFVNENGEFGDKIGAIIDEGKNLTPQERQILTTNSGFDEVVFINDSSSLDISIYQPQNEIKFAGTAVMAAIKELLQIRKDSFDHLICLGNRIDIRIEADVFWVTAPMNIMPPWNLVKVDTVIEIETMTRESAKEAEHTIFWTWLNEQEGNIRAKTFATDWDVPESEANGSGSVLLARMLKREIRVIHGKGSLIFANYLHGTNFGEMGGIVK